MSTENEQKGGRSKRARRVERLDIKKREAFLFMLSYVGRHGMSVAFGLALLVAVDFIQIYIPRIIQGTIDRLAKTLFLPEIVGKNTLLILLLAAAMVVLRFLWRIFIIGTARKIEKEVREDIFSHLQGLGFSFFNRAHTGDLMALMINDVNAIRMATGLAFIALTDAVFMGTLSLFFMFSINVRLALFAIMPLPLILLMMVKFGPSIQSRFNAVQESFASLSTHAQESFSGIRVVKGFAQNGSEVSRFEKECDEYVDRNIALIKVWGFFFPSVALLANLSLTILFLVGGRSIILNTVTFGEFISFTLYINLFVWPVIAIGWVFNLFQRGIASSRRVLELLREQPDVADAREFGRAGGPAGDDGRSVECAAPGVIRGALEARNLSFSYAKGGKEVLRDVTLEVPAGCSLGIMGKPGSGKSTLVSLFFRLFPVPENAIFMDGVEIHSIPLRILRKSIGYVPQDPFLFSDTIRNNIGFGADGNGADTAQVERVARLAGIHEEIAELQAGYDTLVGERGVTLSGGQKQRLSIARALYINPRVLILDDAFSSVDAATESAVLANVFLEMKGRTLLVISHRVSTVMGCDLIIVLDEGRIAERGKHGELLASGRYYATLYELQQLEERIVR